MSPLDSIYHPPTMEDLVEICSYVNRHFCEDKFDIINDELMKINLGAATLEGLSATLRFTFCAKDKLPFWKPFRDAVYHQCLVRDGELRALFTEGELAKRERPVDALLHGLLVD